MMKYEFVFDENSFPAVDADGIVSVLQGNYRATDGDDRWEVTIRAEDLPVTTPKSPIPFTEITREKAEQWLTEYLKRQPAEKGYTDLLEYYQVYMADMIKNQRAENKRIKELGAKARAPKPRVTPFV